ncbi:MAG: LytR/AlgR family response regulator transcription factor [Niabella sp.]
MQCLIVDDNKVARVLLRQLLEKTGYVTIVGECEDGVSANSFLQSKSVDLLFLDIEMPGMSGLELLRMLNDKPLTVLTTAKQGYAVEAFELNVVDYLVKPFSLSRVMLAVERAKELLSHKHTHLNKDNTSSDILFIKDNKSIKKIDINDVLFMEAKGDYVRINVPGNNYVIHGSLKTVEDKFPHNKFLRVHRSYIVALNKIDYIEDRVLYIHDHAIPISESYKDILLQNLNLL